jgi:pyruvoyl-dependent arginine decarboxylase (PvlArgDC)
MRVPDPGRRHPPAPPDRVRICTAQRRHRAAEHRDGVVDPAAGLRIDHPRVRGRDLESGRTHLCVLARSETNEPGRRIAAGIGLARPKDPTHYGYISEHHAFGMSEAQMRDYVEDLAATMLASTLGIEFNPDAAWDERKRVYELSDLIVDSLSITASAEGAANGDWTCAVSAAVFRFAIPPVAP